VLVLTGAQMNRDKLRNIFKYFIALLALHTCMFWFYIDKILDYKHISTGNFAYYVSYVVDLFPFGLPI